MNISRIRKLSPVRPSIVGYVRGVPVFSISGAEGEGSGDGSGGTGEGSGGSEGTGEGKEGEGKEGEGAEGKEGKEGDPRIKELSDEAAKHRVAKKAAEERAAELERQLREITEKDKPELDKLKSAAAELTQQVASLTEDNRKLRLHNTVLLVNTHEFHDPEDALTADFSDVEIDKDGTVNKSDVKKALDALVNKKKHLVKKKEGDGKPPKSGEPLNGRQGGDRTKETTDKLKEKYPGLRR